MKKMICIVCPVGCHLTIDTNQQIGGNRCKRGIDYAIAELTNPTRVLTTTLKTTALHLPRLSVKSRQPLPKAMLMEAMEYLNSIVLNHDVVIGEVIVPNLCNTGISIVATRDLKIKN